MWWCVCVYWWCVGEAVPFPALGRKTFLMTSFGDQFRTARQQPLQCRLRLQCDRLQLPIRCLFSTSRTPPKRNGQARYMQLVHSSPPEEAFVSHPFQKWRPRDASDLGSDPGHTEKAWRSRLETSRTLAWKNGSRGRSLGQGFTAASASCCCIVSLKSVRPWRTLWRGRTSQDEQSCDGPNGGTDLAVASIT